MLDMRTIVFNYMITDIVCMVIIVLLWQQSRKRFAGTAFFVFNFVLQTTALFLIILRGQIPHWMSFVLSNTIVIAGALLGYMGLTRFVGKKIFQIHNYVLLAVFAILSIYFNYVQPVPAARTFILSLALLIICFQCAWLMLGRVEPGMRQMTRGVGIVFAAYCVISVIRIVEFFAGSHSTGDYLQSGAFEQIILLSNQMLFILLTYSLALMFNKRLLLEIETQEEKFSKAFHSYPYAITITRISDGQIIEVNDSFFRITGYQLADVKGNTTIGMHLWDREEDRALIVSELSSKGSVHDREFQFRKKSGDVITGLFSADTIKVKNEICVLSSINDITSIKRAEELLKQSEAQYRLLADHMRETVWLVDMNLKTVYNSPSVQKLRGYTQTEIEALPLDQQITPASVELVMEAFSEEMPKVLADPTYAVLRTLEIEFYRKDGTTYWSESTFSLIRDKSGKPLYFLCEGRDITERKQAEDDLRESEERYRNLFENANEAIFVAQDGNLVFFNPMATQLIGHHAEELQSKSFLEFIHPDDQKMVIDNHIRRMKGEAFPHIYSFRIIHKDGSVRWAKLNAVEINWKGKPATLNFMTDITDRKREDEDILRFNAELENKVAVRTDDLRNSQLALLSMVEDLNESNQKVAVANQSLDAINKELEAFSYSVSHDLRAPLRSIDGFSQALLEDYQKKIDDTGRNYLERIRTATQNMGMLIEDMLKLSRISRFELRRESVDLSKMFREIVKNSQKNDPARIIDVIIQEGIIIECDPAMMNIVLTNLIDNAWKFTGKEARPKIEFGTTDLAGKKVVFIRDNGVGFDMAYVDKLFGAFQRLHTKDEFAGTGIGLATVRRIITRHGGEIWAEGEVGKGTVFYFTLP